MRRFTNDYNVDGKEKRRQAKSSSRSILVVKFKMAAATQTQKIVLVIGNQISSQTKRFEWHNMCNIKCPRKFRFRDIADVALKAVPLSGSNLLLFPVRAIVITSSTCPMRAFVSYKMGGKPFGATGIRAKSFSCFSTPSRARVSTQFTSIDSSSLLTFFGTMNPQFHRGRRASKRFATPTTELINLVLYHCATARAKCLGAARLESCSAAAALIQRSALAANRAESSTGHIGLETPKQFITSLTSHLQENNQTAKS